MSRIFSVVVACILILLAGFAYAGIQADCSNCSTEVLDSQTLRIRHIKNIVMDGAPMAGEYWADVVWSSEEMKLVPNGNVGQEAQIDPILEKSQWLLGKWQFIYTIISTFTNDYTLSTINMQDRNSENGYYVYGTGEFGDAVIASYYPDSGHWALLDPGTIIDRFFVFYTEGVNVLPGSCYYQVDPYSGQITSPCYDLSGFKYSLSTQSLSTVKRQSLKYDAESLEKEESTSLRNAESLPGGANDEVNSTYQNLRERLLGH